MKDYNELEEIVGQNMRLGEFKALFKNLKDRKVANRLVSKTCYLYNEELEKNDNNRIIATDEEGVVVEYIIRKGLIDVILDDNTKCFVTIEFKNNIDTHNEYVEKNNEDKLYITILEVEKRQNQN